MGENETDIVLVALFSLFIFIVCITVIRVSDANNKTKIEITKIQAGCK